MRTRLSSDTLADLGLNANDASVVGAYAAVDPTAASNPMPFDAEAYADIYRQAIAGNLI